MPATRLAGSAPAICFEITSPALGSIGLRAGDLVARIDAPLAVGRLAIASRGGRTIAGIVLSLAPVLLYQPRQIIEIDSSYDVFPVETLETWK